MTQNSDRQETAISHKFEGVGQDTRVFCPEEDEWIAVSAADGFDPSFCPYCGDNAHDASHRVAPRLCEVFCENSTQSTWRYCPICGRRDDNAE